MTAINQGAMLPIADSVDVCTPAYATFTRRLQAMLYDSACLMLIVAFAVSIVAFGQPFAGAGRVAAGVVVLSLLFYEPIMVARFGGTLGHRRRNMRVTVDATGRNPGIVRAFVRFVLKTTLGLPSFVAMAATTRHQALHDQVTGTSVRIHDLAIADVADYRLARSIVPPAERASRLRRALVVVGYIAAMALLCIILLGVLMSRDCLDGQGCDRADSALAGWIPVCWLVGSVWAVVAGWHGRLPGTRTTSGVRDGAT